MGSCSEAAEALTAVIVLFTIVSVLLAVIIAVVLLWTQITAIWRALRERLGKKESPPELLSYTSRNVLQLNPKPSPPEPDTKTPPPNAHPLQTRVVYRPSRSLVQSLPVEGHLGEGDEEEKEKVWMSSSVPEPRYEPVKGEEHEGTDSVFGVKSGSRRGSMDLAGGTEGGGSSSSGMGRKRSLARVSVASIASQLSSFSSKLGMGGQRKSMEFEHDSVELMAGLERDSSSEGSQPTSPAKHPPTADEAAAVGSPAESVFHPATGNYTDISLTD